MLFLPDGTLLVSTYGEPMQQAQDRMGLVGKILRYNADGTIDRSFGTRQWARLLGAGPTVVGG